MKWRRWVITAALLVLVLATGAAYLATRENGTPRKSGKSSATQMPLVDVSPLPTARALASLAITPDEQGFAQEAERIADHEVDLAFADALLQASELRPAQDPQNRDLYLKLQQAQAALADVLSRSEQLKAKIATAKPAEKDALQDQQDLLEAEQALDEDEVEDAQQELIRTGGDQETAIQRQRDQHEAAEHEYDLRQAQAHAPAAPAVDLNAHNLAGQVRAWMWLRDKQARLESARSQAVRSATVWPNSIKLSRAAFMHRSHREKKRSSGRPTFEKELQRGHRQKKTPPPPSIP